MRLDRVFPYGAPAVSASRRSRPEMKSPSASGASRSVMADAARAATCSFFSSVPVASKAAAERGSTPSAAARLPDSVARPTESTSPMFCRTVTAASHAWRGGRSSHRTDSRVAAPRIVHSSTTPDSSIRSSSVPRDGASRSASFQQRRQSPGPRRPARPRRWSASAADTRSVTSLLSPLGAWNRTKRETPESTTALILGTVRLVSATLVARMTRRRAPGGGANTDLCSMRDSEPWSGMISIPEGREPSLAETAPISRKPGRKASTSPPLDPRASSMASVTVSSRVAPFRGGWYAVVMG